MYHLQHQIHFLPLSVHTAIYVLSFREFTVMLVLQFSAAFLLRIIVLFTSGTICQIVSQILGGEIVGHQYAFMCICQ